MGADRHQWQFPANEANKILGWRSDAKGMENKDWFDPGTIGAAGQELLEAETEGDARDVLQISEMVQVQWYGTVDKTGVASSQTAVASAVADAYANGYDLYWPAGTYLTTASIPNFHDVRHYGPGKVKRGSDVYAVDPLPSNTNKLYIDYASGNSSDDGLSASEPIDSFINAINAISTTRNVFQGVWEFVVADGTAVGVGEDLVKNLFFTKRAILRGTSCTPASLTSVGTPTAITKAANAQVTLAGHGLSTGARVKLVDLGGMVELNGSVGTVTVVDANNFTIGIDTTGYTTFTSGGTVWNIPIPNTIFDGNSINDYWLTVSGYGVWLEIRNIKLVDYDTVGRGGFYANDGSNLYLNNLHIDNCDTGVFTQRRCLVRHNGGIIENCGNAGIKTVSCGYSVVSGTQAAAPTIMDCFNGLDMQEVTDSEMLKLTIERCSNIGCDSNVMSHVKTTDAIIKNCGIGVRAMSSNWYGPNTYFYGNTQNIQLLNGGTDQQNFATAQDQRRIAYSGTSRSHTGDTALTELTPDLFTFPSGMLDAAGKKIKVVARGDYTPGGAPDLYTLQCYIRNLATQSVSSFSTTAHEFEFVSEIIMTGAAAELMVTNLTDGIGNARTKSMTRTHNLSGSAPLDLRVQLNNAGDTITVHYVEVFFIG
ncbi:ubiquitin-activating E1 FCCH domain-containing protein [Nitratireductor indicus]|uniref:ubiquitin-activating E1 FCCH domain-containing protein n=1 Tax=Nitratireductor indicus TaxID=721133 RepID=UPI00287612F4|nr:ubiquitin-activating E1 FCCH domain-containing protein [Nitratireductor indicus]MDS1138576.1 ubiquitin-activating E1 FCCH domain-containing protein [Nitratireductor indicus]